MEVELARLSRKRINAQSFVECGNYNIVNYVIITGQVH